MQLDAGADDVDLGGALGLLGVGVVADELAGAVAQFAQAGADLGVGAGLTGEPVGRKPRN